MRDLLKRAGLHPKPMTSPQIAGFTRRAYDPGSESMIDQLLSDPDLAATALTFDDSGPLEGDDSDATYFRHDNAKSMTWCVYGFPTTQFDEQILAPLLAPDPKVPYKRVAVVYRPHRMAESSKTADKALTDAGFGAQQTSQRGLLDPLKLAKRDSTARMREEVAHGAGLVRVGILITITVDLADTFEDAKAWIYDKVVQCGMKSRAYTRSHSAAFAAALGIGVMLEKERFSV